MEGKVRCLFRRAGMGRCVVAVMMRSCTGSWWRECCRWRCGAASLCDARSAGPSSYCARVIERVSSSRDAAGERASPRLLRHPCLSLTTLSSFPRSSWRSFCRTDVFDRIAWCARRDHSHYIMDPSLQTQTSHPPVPHPQSQSHFTTVHTSSDMTPPPPPSSGGPPPEAREIPASVYIELIDHVHACVKMLEAFDGDEGVRGVATLFDLRDVEPEICDVGGPRYARLGNEIWSLTRGRDEDSRGRGRDQRDQQDQHGQQDQHDHHDHHDQQSPGFLRYAEIVALLCSKELADNNDGSPEVANAIETANDAIACSERLRHVLSCDHALSDR